MADGKRLDPRRAHHTAEEPSAWEQGMYVDYIQGKSYRQLAEIHDCHHSHIGNIVRRVIEWKRPQMRKRIEESTQELIDQHLELYQQAMTAWSESRGQMVKETVTERAPTVDRNGNQRSGNERKTERQYSSGDPRHLTTAIKALKEYREIIGYRPPSPDDDSNERVAGKTFSEVIDREMEKLKAIKARQLDQPRAAAPPAE